MNLYVYRATDPKELKVCQDPIGQENSLYIREESSEAVLQSNGGGYKRDREVMNLIKGRETNCLSTKKAGHTRHRLYVRDQELILYQC